MIISHDIVINRNAAPLSKFNRGTLGRFTPHRLLTLSKRKTRLNCVVFFFLPIEDNIWVRVDTEFLFECSSNISKTRASVSSGVPNTEKVMEAASCFYCFEVFGTPDESRSTSF